MTLSKHTRHLVVLTAAFTLSYAAVSPLVNLFQGMFIEEYRIALDFFRPYRQLDAGVLAVTLLRGALIALVLLPARQLLDSRLLFFTLWGLTVICSLEPLPGTIEGIIYTKTTLIEHLFILAFSAVQCALCVLAWRFCSQEAVS